MTNKEFQSLLDKMHRAAVKHMTISQEVNRAFLDRYVATYGELDLDWIIDSLDYGHSARITVEEADKQMHEALERGKR